MIYCKMNNEIYENWQNILGEREVPVQSLFLHRIHCERNHFKCTCGEVVKISEKDSPPRRIPRAQALCALRRDDRTFTAEVPCPNKPRTCKFCEAEFPFDVYAKHIFECGSRTEQCPKCQKYIPFRDLEHHQSLSNCSNKFPKVKLEVKKHAKAKPNHFKKKESINFEERSRRLSLIHI